MGHSGGQPHLNHTSLLPAAPSRLGWHDFEHPQQCRWTATAEGPAREGMV